MSPTGHPPWALPVRATARLARRAALGFWLFSGAGTAVLLATLLLSRSSAREAGEIAVALGGSLVGLAIGQGIALLRLRISMFILLWNLAFWAGLITLGATHASGFLAASFAFATVAALSGFFSLQHRFELLACFWGTVGWIGSIMVLLNAHGRIAQWRESKLAAWLPVTLLLLAGFVATLIVYLVCKHSYRLVLWQIMALPEPPPGRVEAPRGSVLSTRNLLPVVALAVLVFTFTATVSPFLWRTAPGHDQATAREAPPSRGEVAETLTRAVEQLRRAVERSWPWWLILLISLLLDRPLRRTLLLHRLRRPLERVAPTRRIEQLWRYVMVAAGDTGVTPTPGESIPETVARLARDGRPAAQLYEAAGLYERARFGLGLGGGEVTRMAGLADAVFRQLRRGLTPWQRLKGAYRRLT